MKTTINHDILKDIAPIILRISLALVFLYFGISQLVSPSFFVGWIPAEASIIPLTARTLVILNGAFEVIAGLLLLLGFYTRISSLLLGLHLLAITFSIGFTEIGVRDFGLSIATLAIAMYGPDKICAESVLRKRSDTTAQTSKQDKKDKK